MKDKSVKPIAVKDLLDFLFKHIHHPEGRSYTVTEVADATGLSYVTIYTLLQGRSKKPTLPTVQALSDFFGVPLSFFECKSYEECYSVLENVQDADEAQEALPANVELGEIIFRARELSPEAQHDLLTLVKWVQAAERQREAGKDVPEFPPFPVRKDKPDDD